LFELSICHFSENHTMLSVYYYLYCPILLYTTTILLLHTPTTSTSDHYGPWGCSGGCSGL
jgi:hypothetical protein